MSSWKDHPWWLSDLILVWRAKQQQLEDSPFIMNKLWKVRWIKYYAIFSMTEIPIFAQLYSSGNRWGCLWKDIINIPDELSPRRFQSWVCWLLSLSPAWPNSSAPGQCPFSNLSSNTIYLGTVKGLEPILVGTNRPHWQNIYTSLPTALKVAHSWAVAHSRAFRLVSQSYVSIFTINFLQVQERDGPRFRRPTLPTTHLKLIFKGTVPSLTVYSGSHGRVKIYFQSRRRKELYHLCGVHPFRVDVITVARNGFLSPVVGEDRVIIS